MKEFRELFSETLAGASQSLVDEIHREIPYLKSLIRDEKTGEVKIRRLTLSERWRIYRWRLKEAMQVLRGSHYSRSYDDWEENE